MEPFERAGAAAGTIAGDGFLPPMPQRWPHRQSTDATEVGQVIVVWSRSVVASERLHSWLEIQGAGGLGQSAIQGGETGATLTAQQV